MPIRDILLQMNSYPLPTPPEAIDAADRLAERFGARVSAALCQVNIPRVSNFLADKLVNANVAIADENRKSRSNAEELLAAFAKRVAPARLGRQNLIECTTFVTTDELVALARVHDLTILPSYHHPETESVTEALIFASGRPALLLPSPAPPPEFNTVVIGWDGSRTAARALADALPFCASATSVCVVAVTGEKDLAADRVLSRVREHLEAHEIDAEYREVPAEGLGAGTALLRYCERVEANLLVMGAYGHSRVREFIMGGATRTILSAATVPVLLSH